jgi:putative methionine-R-sulfoxide reductase with GAF domain
MSSGSLIQLKVIDSADEFGAISKNINQHLQSLQNKNQFIRNTSDLKFDSEPEVLSADDELGLSLKKMKTNLIEKDKKEQISKEEKAIQDRHVAGLAEFGGILRHNTEQPELLAYELVSNLVKFLNADVCGIYLLSADNELVPMATYAYNERKIYEKIILPGEGLVGTCALEKTTFYFDNLPDDYIKIISGFGKVKPKTLLITPLVLNREVFGVVEMASLNDFRKADVRFLESLGEDIAATLAFMRVKNLTSAQMKKMAAGFLKSSFAKKTTPLKK